jgi:hypothetical protein
VPGGPGMNRGSRDIIEDVTDSLHSSIVDSPTTASKPTASSFQTSVVKGNSNQGILNLYTSRVTAGNLSNHPSVDSYIYRST